MSKFFSKQNSYRKLYSEIQNLSIAIKISGETSLSKIWKPSVICLLLFNSGTTLHAEILPNLSLEAAIQRVELYQAKQTMWNTQENIAQANLKQSKLWVNPELSIQQSGFDAKQEQELSIAISQPLDVFGARKAQQQRAELSLAQIQLQQKIYQAQLQLSVQYLWSQLALFELERDIVLAQFKVSQENLNAIQKRYQAGSVAQVDVDRAQISQAENRRLYHQADLQRQIATQQLSHVWGEDHQNIQVALSADSLWPNSTARQVQDYLSENLFEKNQRLKVLQSQAEVRHLQAQSRPNPTVNVGMNRTKAPENSTENQLVLGISIPLNIFDRQQYALEIAQAKQDALHQQQKFYLKQNTLQIKTLLTELTGLHLQFQEVEKVQIPLAAQVQRKTLMGFSAGKFSVTEVQQATLQLQEVQMLKVRLLKDAWQRAIAVESLSLGIEPDVVMAKDAIAQINQNLWSETQALPVIAGSK